MQNTFDHLAFLLTEHDCVIIPGFGGFVIYREKAQCISDKGIFIPPASSVGFNAQLSHNDNLLVHSLMRAGNISYKAAQEQVEQFTEEIRKELDTTGEIIFSGIGTLSMSSDGKKVFSPSKNKDLNALAYGLSNFYLPLLSELEVSMPARETFAGKKDRQVIMIPVSKRLLRTVATAVAIIAGILMISTPIDNRSLSQYASVIDSGSIITDHPASAAVITRTAVPEAAEIKEIQSCSQKHPETVSPQIQVTETKETPEVKPEIKAEPKPVSGRTYYIIVSSSPTRKSAENFLPGIKSNLNSQAGILEKDNLFRIYVAQFSDKKEAEAYLSGFREKYPEHRNAWLLSARNQ